MASQRLEANSLLGSSSSSSRREGRVRHARTHALNSIEPHQWLAQFKAALICSTVVLMRLLTVATDSAFSFDDGRLLTRI
jgi:hypothetical protein